MDDQADDIDEQEREALDRVLFASLESAKASELRPASTLLETLRHQRLASAPIDIL